MQALYIFFFFFFTKWFSHILCGEKQTLTIFIQLCLWALFKLARRSPRSFLIYLMRLLIWVFVSFRFALPCLLLAGKTVEENRTLARCCCNCASNFRATWVLCVFGAAQFSRRQPVCCWLAFRCLAFPIFHFHSFAFAEKTRPCLAYCCCIFHIFLLLLFFLNFIFMCGA